MSPDFEIDEIPSADIPRNKNGLEVCNYEFYGATENWLLGKVLIIPHFRAFKFNECF